MTTPIPPDLATRAADIDDPMLLLARIGYRAYRAFRGDPHMLGAAFDEDMIADLDRLAELLDATAGRCQVPRI